MEKWLYVKRWKRIFKKGMDAQNNIYSEYRNVWEFNLNTNISKKNIKNINKANYIYIFGHGNSFFAAKNLEISMTVLGYKASLNFGDWFSDEVLKYFKANDLIIYFTERATGELANQIVEPAKKGSNIWMITHNTQINELKNMSVLYYEGKGMHSASSKLTSYLYHAVL